MPAWRKFFVGVTWWPIFAKMGGGKRLQGFGFFHNFALNDGSPEEKKESPDIIFSTRILVVNFGSPENPSLAGHPFRKLVCKFSDSPEIFYMKNLDKKFK